jgi:hypothetical protein
VGDEIHLRLSERQDTLRFTLPVPPEGQARGWLGAVAHRSYLLERLAALSPLFPRPAGTAWLRMADLTPWVPVLGLVEPTGTSLVDIADSGRMTMDLLWQVVQPVTDLIARAAAESIACTRVEPERLLVAGGKLAAWDSPLAWEPAVGDTARDPVRVAASLLHWLLCAVRKNPREAQPPGTLWAVCARGLEGEYESHGLTRFRTELSRLAPPSGARRPRSAWVIDVDNVRAATRSLPDPWRMLQAWERFGHRPDLVLAVHERPVPEAVAALWAEAGWQSVAGEAPWSRAAQLAGPYPQVTVLTGDATPAACHARIGRAASVVALTGADDSEPMMAPLHAALMLVSGRN